MCLVYTYIARDKIGSGNHIFLYPYKHHLPECHVPLPCLFQAAFAKAKV